MFISLAVILSFGIIVANHCLINKWKWNSILFFSWRWTQNFNRPWSLMPLANSGIYLQPGWTSVKCNRTLEQVADKFWNMSSLKSPLFSQYSLLICDTVARHSFKLMSVGQWVKSSLETLVYRLGDHTLQPSSQEGNSVSSSTVVLHQQISLMKGKSSGERGRKGFAS